MVKSIAWQITRGLAYLHGKRVAHRDLKPENILIMGDGLERGLIKIADFGLARKIAPLARPLDENGPVVTLWYRAPELLLGAKHYDEAIDAWAAGAIFGELANLAPLFRGVEAPGAGARRDMYDRSQLEKIFAVLGVPNGNQKPENRKPDGDAKGDDASWPDAACHPFWPRAVEDGLSRVARVGFPRRLAEDPNHASLLNLVRALCRYDPRRRPSAADALTHPYFAETPEPSRNALDPGAEKPETYPRRKIKSAEDGAPREAGEATRGPAPRGAAGAAALNAVRSYGDLMR
jgi:cyclin-dependent kinase 8/11